MDGVARMFDKKGKKKFLNDKVNDLVYFLIILFVWSYALLFESVVASIIGLGVLFEYWVLFVFKHFKIGENK